MLAVLQPYLPYILLAAGLAMFFPEIKKAFGWVSGAGGKINLPTFAATSTTATPTLVEATQAAYTLQQHYACRCNEAQAKLQVALTHFYDPVVKPQNVIRPNNLQEAVQLLSAAVAPQSPQASE